MSRRCRRAIGSIVSNAGDLGSNLDSTLMVSVSCSRLADRPVDLDIGSAEADRLDLVRTHPFLAQGAGVGELHQCTDRRMHRRADLAAMSVDDHIAVALGPVTDAQRV